MTPNLHTNPLPPAEDPEAEFHAAVLNELIGLGIDLARRIHATAVEATTPPAPGEPASDPQAALPEIGTAFDRVARAVRRTVLLARHLRERPAPATLTQARARELVRRGAIRDLEDEMNQARRPETEQAAIRREFIERLDSPETEADFQDIPTGTVIRGIRRDLGLAIRPDEFKRRSPEEAALLARLAASLAATFPPPDNARDEGAPPLRPRPDPQPLAPHPRPARPPPQAPRP